MNRAWAEDVMPMVRAFLLGLLFLFMAVMLNAYGCDHAAVRQQARAADLVARAFNDVARPTLVAAYEAECRAAIERACPAPPCDRLPVLEAFDACDARWQVVFAAYEAAKRAHDGWRVTLTRCQATPDAGGCTADLERDARHAMDAVRGYRCAVRGIGRADLDPVPGAPECDVPDA